MTRRFVTVAALGVCLLMGALGNGPGAAEAQQPELVLATRGPRFLQLSSPREPPVAIDVRSSALLRQVIALDIDRATVGDVLSAIERQTGIKFIYSRNVIAVDRPVRVRAQRITVAGALTEILIDAGVDVLLKGNHLALVERPPLAKIRAGTLVGRVVDAKTAQGVSGAEVFLEGTRWRTSADTAGRYRLAEVDSGTYTLTVRRFGYAKQSRKVVVHEEREDTTDVALAAVAVPLNELVTTATGPQRRRDLGNAITTIRADSVLQNAPIKSLTDLLTNRVPGLAVQHTSGAPGDPAKLRLRGISSVRGTNDPIVYVDGVRIYATQSEARSGNLTNLDPGDTRANPVDVPAPSPLDQIDPNIIDKIEVFKGPSAATLYGADAANGVIVITTKRGKPGPARWHASFTQSRTNIPGQYPTGYYRWGRDLLLGVPRFCTLVDVLCVQDSLVRFQALNDPSLTVLGRGRRTALSLTASGGSSALTYSVTGSYSDDDGPLTLPAFESQRFQTLYNREPPRWMRQPHNYKTWSVTSSVTALLSPSAQVTLLTTLSRSEQQRTSLERQLASLSATYVDTVNGVYYRPGADGYALTSTSAILQDYYVRQTASAITFTTGLNGSWRPRPWFDASAQAGLNVMPRDDQLLLPAGLVAATDSGAFVRGTGRSLVGTFNLQGAARKWLGKGFVFETNLGANLQTSTTSDLIGSAAGLVPGTTSLTGAKRIAATEGRVNTSVFGWYVEPRISGQRISVSTGLRIDGGSAYGARITGSSGSGNPFSLRNLFGLRSLLTLPKLNGSWVISEEPFFPFKSFFSSLRLRGAYGQSQTQPGPADRLRLYTGSLNHLGEVLTLTTVGNTHLRPERGTEFEGGFDADMLNGRAAVELTLYRKLQVDALMPVALPGSINGGGSIIQNIGNIRNVGVELTVGATPIRSPALSWSTQLTYSRNDNVLTKLGAGVAPNRVQGLVEGYPVGGRWARPILGFADQNGDGVLQPQEIQVGDSLMYMGRLQPAYQTVFNTNVVLFGGAVGVAAGFSYAAGETQVDSTARKNWVLARALVDPAAPLSDQAAVLASTKGQGPTDYGLMQTVSTFRFNSLSVTYRAPLQVARFLRAQRLSVAVQGDNLGLHSTYHGKDPDVNAWSPGENVADTGQLPLPRTWQLRVDLEY